MSPIARDLAQENPRKIAGYFAARVGRRDTRPPLPRRRPEESPSASQPYHQPNFQGRPPAKADRLSYEYLVAAMCSFAIDERTNNGHMPKFMQALTDSERDAMARYLSAP
jgi:hypothetical protein